MDVSSLGGAFTAVAVDAPGKQIVVAVSGDNGAVYQAAGGQFTPLASMANPVSLSFSSDGQTLYALDAAALTDNGREPSAATGFKLWRCRE